MSDKIVIGENGVTLYQAMTLKHGLKALVKGFQVNSGYTSTRCRQMAGRFTGKTYKAGKMGLAQAATDMEALIAEAAPAVQAAGNISHA